jgi:4-amino-4-deoxy-L-arabinose transferase-like glycosyltransferase
MNIVRLSAWIERRQYWILAALLVVALGIRVVVTLPALSNNQGFRMGDDDDYHRYAVSLVTHGQFSDGMFRAYRMPLFPMFLAGIYFVFGIDPVRAQLLMTLVGVANVALAFLLGRQLGGLFIGLFAASIVAIDPSQIRFSGMLMTETLCVALLTSSLLACLWLREYGGLRWAAVVGVLLGCLILTRVNMLIVVPFVCLWLLRYGKGDLRMRAATCATIALMCSLFLGAWVIRNFTVFGSFVPMTTGGGGVYYGIFNDATTAPQSIWRYGIWRSQPLPAEIAGLNELARDTWMRATAWSWVRAHPISALQVWLMQPIHFWGIRSNNPLAFLLLLLGIPGISALRNQANPNGILLGLMCIALTFMTLVTLGLSRFNMPLVPALASLAGVGLVHIWAAIQQRLRPAVASQYH